MAKRVDLNDIKPVSDGGHPAIQSKDNSASSEDGAIRVYFREITSQVNSVLEISCEPEFAVAWPGLNYV